MTARHALALVAALVATLVLAASSAAPGSAALGPATPLSNDVVQNLSPRHPRRCGAVVADR